MHIFPVTVTVGDEVCDVTASSASQITCTLSDVGAGTLDIVVTSQPGGAAMSDAAFTYLFAATSVMPATGMCACAMLRISCLISKTLAIHVHNSKAFSTAQLKLENHVL